MLVSGEVARRDDGGGVLALLERDDVHHGRPAGMAAADGKLMHLDAVDLPFVGKEEHVVMGRRHKEVLDEVVVLEREALDALAAALLRAIGRDGQALHVTRVSHRDDHVLLGNEVIHVEDDGRVRDGGAALVGKLLLDLEHLGLDDAQDLLLIRQ